jgi:hypothetical protein
MPAPENPAPNKLYYGDNLAVLRDYIPPPTPSTSSTTPAPPVRSSSPSRAATFRKAPRSRPDTPTNLTLNLE